MSVLVVDYGMGNLASAARSVEECGGKVEVSADPAAASRADRMVIPGVGAFTMAMERLHSRGWVEAIDRFAKVDRLPVLGVCLGMQLLLDEGDEMGRTKGLGLIAGRVERLTPVAGERVPHVGWNRVETTGDPLFGGIASGNDFYFVHSYHAVVADPADTIATTPYCGGFVSAIRRGNVMGTQFHPEKSSRAGFQLIRNFLALRRGG